MLLFVRVFRIIREEQPREGELLRGRVTIDQLRRDVEENPVVVLVRVVQRTVRHHEEIFRGQPESVRGGSSDVRAVYRDVHPSHCSTTVTMMHTIAMDHFTIIHHATWAGFAIVPKP